MRTVDRRARPLVVALALVAALALAAGCGGSAAADRKPVATTRVEMPPSYRFDPPVITVKAGTTVTWHNGDHFTHSVRLQDGSGVEKVVKPGQSASITFDKPGEYRYDCGFHPRDMRGEVIVTQ
ncbi:MAG: cupredoxin domain-containing protein [Thermomicrobiaceae bacterium]|nr:cupredoxin domain-containing protein [Thermomicrobiaceae bacterium]